MAGIGQIIYGADYNAVQVKVDGVLGFGSGYGGYAAGYGYEQILTSSLVNPTNVITALQWQHLVNDVNTCYLHQNGVNWPSLFTVSGTISYTNLVLLDGIANSLLTNRLNIAANQRTQTLVEQITGTGNWAGTNIGQTTNDFGTTSNLYTYFNQGGTFKIVGAGPNQNTAQDVAWHTELAAVNYTVTYADFTNAWNARGNKSPSNLLTLYSNTGGGAYTSNNLTLSLQITSDQGCRFMLVLQDGHVGISGGPDNVSPGVQMNVYRLAATGAFTGLLPTSNIVNTAFT
jgi:hypothetical protein